MKFRFYIADTFDGVVTGTDDETLALERAACEEYFVIDVETGEWILPDGREAVVAL